jgi:NADH-quinone oxidoreductase subunit N
LVASSKDKAGSQAALSYTLFGLTASACMLYGASLLYVRSGSLLFANWQSIDFQLGMLLFWSGLLFKLAALPFHFWVADVYEKAPSSVVAYLSVFPKWVAIVVFWNIYTPNDALLTYALLALGVGSMLVGNIGALAQKNVKRMLAYSGIAHTGFWLLGLAWHSSGSFEALFYYWAIYAILNTGILLWLLESENQGFAGNFDSVYPMPMGWLVPVSLVVLLVGLAGLPPTAGFSAKLLLFTSLWEAAQSHQVWLIVFVIGLLNTPIALFYYLKIPYFIALRKNILPIEQTSLSLRISWFLLVVMSILALVFFVKPEGLLWQF